MTTPEFMLRRGNFGALRIAQLPGGTSQVIRGLDMPQPPTSWERGHIQSPALRIQALHRRNEAPTKTQTEGAERTSRLADRTPHTVRG